MNRIETFTDKSGKVHENTGRASAPFALMLNEGDWFEIPSHLCRKPKLLAIQCAQASRRLGRRFEFRTVMFNGECNYRVTLVQNADEPVLAERRWSKAKRIERFTRANGDVAVNDDTELDGSPSRFPFGIMDVGDWFEVEGTRRDVSGAWSAACRFEKKWNVVFSLELPEGAFPRIIRTR